MTVAVLVLIALFSLIPFYCRTSVRTIMMSIRMFSYCCLVFGMSVLFLLVVSGETRKQRTVIHFLCYTESQYGTVLNTYNDICGLMSCVAICMDNNQCESCTYDDTYGTCSLNSLIRTNFPTCDRNVKYAQMREYQCEISGDSRICGLDLHTVAGELHGYVEVNLNGVWGTVCDHHWQESSYGLQNAGVLCSSFGYSNGTPIYPLGSSSFFTGEILSRHVMCSGTETNLLECGYFNATHCIHDEDVRVRCF